MKLLNRHGSNRKTKKSWLWEFTKKILFLCSSLYAIERIFIMVMICINRYENIDVFVQTGSEVFMASVVAYALKAGCENVFKIRKDTGSGVDN